MGQIRADLLRIRFIVGFVLLILGLNACLNPLAGTTFAPTSPASTPIAYENAVLGVQVTDTAGLRVVEDGMVAPDSTWGFSLVKTENGGNGALVLRVSLVEQAPPDVNQAAAKLIAAFPALPIQQVDITVDGIPGKLLFNLPSMSGATIIYLAIHQQLYQILYAAETLDATGQRLLRQLHFIKPTRTLASLGLKRASDEPIQITSATEQALPKGPGTQLSSPFNALPPLTLTPTQQLTQTSGSATVLSLNTTVKTVKPLTPVATAPRLFPYSWSPDGNILAYWTFTAEEVKEDFKYPPGTLHFFDVRTQQSCALPYQLSYYGEGFAWLSTGQILLVTDAQAADAYQVMLGAPCAKDFTNLTNFFPTRVYGVATHNADRSQFLFSSERGYWLYTPQTQTVYSVANAIDEFGGRATWSPTSKDRVTFTRLAMKNAAATATTFVVDLRKDLILDTIQWPAHLGENTDFSQLLWLNEQQGLIPETLNQGPLLVTLGQKPMPIATKLFGLPPRRFQWASAAPTAQPNGYHIVFSSPMTDEVPSTTLPLRLYHSETGKIEELPFQHLISTPGPEPFQHQLGFSPDGKWLLGFDDSSSNIWLWPVDDEMGQGVQLPLHGANSTLVWKEDSTQIAVGGYGGMMLFAVPSGTQTGFVKTDDYHAEPFGWSPNGQWLTARGIGYGQEGLFVIPRDTELSSSQGGQTDQNKPLTPTVTSLITSTLSITTPSTTFTTSGLLRLSGQLPSTMALDSQYVYWVAYPGYHELYRYPLSVNAQTPATVTVVATSHYREGVLGQYPIVSMKGWLIFYDSAYNAISSTWQLRALNLADGTEQLLAESKGNKILYGFAAANNRVVWSWAEEVSGQACPNQAVLSMVDFANGQPKELNRACFQTEHYWRAVSMDGDRLAAEYWQYTVEPGKTLGDIVLFDLSAPDPTRFTVLKASPAARQNSYPSLSGDWVTWQRGTRTQNNCVLLDLRTKTQVALPTEWWQTNCQFVQAAGNGVFSFEEATSQSLPLYQMDQHKIIHIQAKTKGEIEATAVSNHTIALAVQTAPEQTKRINSVIEWTRLASTP